MPYADKVIAGIEYGGADAKVRNGIIPPIHGEIMGAVVAENRILPYPHLAAAARGIPAFDFEREGCVIGFHESKVPAVGLGFGEIEIVFGKPQQEGKMRDVSGKGNSRSYRVDIYPPGKCPRWFIHYGRHARSNLDGMPNYFIARAVSILRR